MKIGIIGGDLRVVKLAKIFINEGNELYTYGMDKSELKATECENIKEVSIKTDFIISSIPFSKDNENIIAKFTDKKLIINKVLSEISGKKLICGNVSKDILNLAKSNNVEIIDLLKEEELTILNAIPTAEGAIEIAMRESDITLHNSNVLILGFGRIGKILAKMLQGIGANVYCEARKKEDLAWIEAYKYNTINLKDLEQNINKYDFIFNTIPNLILDKNKLKKVKKECVIIDLASSPGGTDFEEASKLNLKAILALGLPGKVAPKTAAKYIKETIRKFFKE